MALHWKFCTLPPPRPRGSGDLPWQEELRQAHASFTQTTPEQRAAERSQRQAARRSRRALCGREHDRELCQRTQILFPGRGTRVFLVAPKSRFLRRSLCSRCEIV